MRRIFFGLIVISTVVVSSIALGFNSNEDKLKEGPDTTYVQATSKDIKVKQSPFEKDRTIKEQILESNMIVKGEVVDIVEVVQTEDLIDSGMAEAQDSGYKFIHTNVLFKVEEYLGPQKLSYKEIVIRHPGGRIGNSVHEYEAEHLSIGEELLLFRLTQPDQMTQIPSGYDKEQYFLFQPYSKYVSSEKGFKPGYKNGDAISLQEVKNVIQAVNN